MAYNNQQPYNNQYPNQQQYPNQPYPNQAYPNQYPNQPGYPNQYPYPNQSQNVGWNQNAGYGGQPSMQQPTAPPHQAEDGLPKASLGFSEKSIRQGFIRKVFILVTIMLAIVAIMTAIPFIDTSNNFSKYIQKNAWIYWVSYLTFFVVYLILVYW
uniref:Uncharacterized protein n=1 Tax=Acrobeloides nanus TaxID=290746 RepID=A0A914E1T4_9BILA